MLAQQYLDTDPVFSISQLLNLENCSACKAATNDQAGCLAFVVFALR